MSADNQTAPRPLQTAVWLLIVLNTAIYAAWFWQSGFVYRQLALWPVDGWYPFRPWQLLSYGFIHDRVFVFHLLLNMFALWSFGGLLESKLGRCRFVVFFLACIVGAGLCQLAITAAMAVNAPTIGASGGLFGLLAAVALRFGDEELTVLLTPIEVRARTLVAVIAVAELLLALWLPHSRIAHGAHIGGLLSGFLLSRLTLFKSINQ